METKTPEMAKAYNHQLVEERLYDFWLRCGYFTPQVDWQKKPFVISMPPPNITGELHHGHAMMISFEDTMIRWRRMQGYVTLWLPGSDHAGIATQNVVEEELAKEGLTRHTLGREAFVQRVWQWKQKYGAIITGQIRRMGASCDWTRERFTLDDGLSRAVREAFVRLYSKGLIYRGEYMVNWCPRCSTAISDLEVDHIEVSTKLYYVQYPLLKDDSGGESGEFITVATTRPETILGDTAVAVNPNDERYKKLIGRKARLPAIGRIIPIIADGAVDADFGTGAVKVTPAHDPVDYEIGQRHGLEAVNVMTPGAAMNELAGKYAGLDRYQCRQELLKDLESEGLLVKVEDYQHSLGHCSRCDTVIEPTISEQWFVRIKPLAERAIQVVRDGHIRFVPERFSKVYFNWMENIRDWCISRQLWWGHRIPVWYCRDCGHLIAAVDTPQRCPKCRGRHLEQDPDVLDTWFSSALWPFSTLGWPSDTEDLRYFYPTSVMETGYDILFFWVARMIMMGLECTDNIPFHTVYLHGLMRDEKGEKMSKSKGNVANPLDVIDQYGADALRFSIVTGSTPGNDTKLSSERLQGARNFANKLWNAARFVQRGLLALGPVAKPTDEVLELEDRWIISRCSQVTREATRLMEQYEFGEAGQLIYEFLWGEFCDWFIEMSKLRLYGESDTKGNVAYSDTPAARVALWVLVEVLDTMLRLLHPFMPFVTEEVWQHLRTARQPIRDAKSPETIATQPWPLPGLVHEHSEEQIELLIGIIRAIRNARAEAGVEATRYIEAIVVASQAHQFLKQKGHIITRLARVQPLMITRSLAEKPKRALSLRVGATETYLPLAGMFDIAQEEQRLEKEASRLSSTIRWLEEQLSKPDFLTKAPAHILDRERAKLASHREALSKLNERLALLRGM